jgi:hypothetical protein
MCNSRSNTSWWIYSFKYFIESVEFSALPRCCSSSGDDDDDASKAEVTFKRESFFYGTGMEN